jgi:glycosyltransferase involved in cell wall biosynthesis
MQSVLKQSHTNLELIVVDDGSTDDTPHVVAACGDPRVRYAAHSVNKGASAARNTGIAMASGPYVAFQDSDDLWRQDKLTVQIQALEQSEAAVCVCSHRMLGARHTTEVIRENRKRKGNDVIHNLLRGEHISPQTIVARTNVLKESGGFDESLRVSEDYELCLRLAERHDFVFVSRMLVDVYFSQDSLSGDPLSFAQAAERIIDKHAELFAHHRRGGSALLFKAAKHFGYANEIDRSKQYAWRALRVNPLNVRAATLLVALSTGTVPFLRKVRPSRRD